MIGGRARQAVQHDERQMWGSQGYGTGRQDRARTPTLHVPRSSIAQDPPRLGAFSIFTLKRGDISNLYIEAGTIFIADELCVL